MDKVYHQMEDDGFKGTAPRYEEKMADRNVLDPEVAAKIIADARKRMKKAVRKATLA